MPEAPKPPSREVLLTFSAEQLVTLLLQSWQAIELAANNMAALGKMLAQTTARYDEAKSKLDSQEAELIVLRNRP